MGQRPEQPLDQPTGRAARPTARSPVGSTADEADETVDRVDGKIELLTHAAAQARAYVAGERGHRVTPADGALDQLRDTVEGITADEPIGASDAVELIAEIGEVGAVRSTGGRYFGFVNGGVGAAALAASVVSAPWDQNVALPVMSPAAALLDEAAARLIVDALSLPAGTVASFCAGATIANITAVVTARDSLLRQAGWDPSADGLRGSPPVRVVTSEEIHISVLKALRVAGFGRADIQFVATDDTGGIIADELPPANVEPTLVLLQAGNVNTGGSDPFNEVADRLGGDNTWIHVDGAFGLWAAASPTRRPLLAGVERADSWATDAHKWLNAPYDCGVVLCKHPESLSDAMAMDAAYVSTAASDRALMNLGLQMSQGARAVPVFAAMATEGRAGIARIVDHTCDLATRFATHLSGAGAEVLAPVELNQVLVSFGDGPSTEEVIARVQAGGVCWMGGTTWKGVTAMRISVCDSSTTEADVDASIAELLGAWAETRRTR